MADAVAGIPDNTMFSTPANLQGWSNLIDSLFGKSSTETSNQQQLTQLGSAADAPMMAIIQQLMGQAQGVNSPQMQALLAPIFAQFRDVALPGIQNAANAGGGVYNSTTQQLLKNDALARATAQGGGALVAQQNNLQQQLAALLGILARSTQTTAQATQGSKQSSTSGNAGNIGKLAGMGAGAAAAAKAIRSLTSSKINDQSARFESIGDQEGDYPEYPAQGRSDRQDDTSGMPPWTPNSDMPYIDARNAINNDYNSDSDPAAFWGTETAGASGYTDPGNSFLDGIFGGNEGGGTGGFEGSGGFGAGEYFGGDEGGGDGGGGVIFGGMED